MKSLFPKRYFVADLEQKSIQMKLLLWFNFATKTILILYFHLNIQLKGNSKQFLRL